MAGARRQIKNCSFSYSKPEREVVKDSQLQECLTFRR